MGERSAVQQLDRSRSRVGGLRIAVAAGASDRQAELRPKAMAAGEDRVAQRLGQLGGLEDPLSSSSAAASASRSDWRGPWYPPVLCPNA